MNIPIWKRKKYYYNILRVLMTIFIIRLVAILYSWLMAIIMAHFKSKFSSYYSKLKFNSNIDSRYYSDVMNILNINSGSEHRYSSSLSGSLL